MYKRAIILAGGKGTRLFPYTISLPKPLVPISDKPILEIIILQLKKYGFNYITISVNHYADIIKAFFGDGSRWDLKIDYTLEEKPLSTMGPLRLIQNLPENFLVMNGDVLTDLNFNDFFNYHVENKNTFTISSFRRNEKIDYGVLETEKDKLVSFNEKPSYEFKVSMGIYMLNKKIVELIPADTFFGFDNLMKIMIQSCEYPNVLEHSGYWLDIGRPSDYELALAEIDKFHFL